MIGDGEQGFIDSLVTNRRTFHHHLWIAKVVVYEDFAIDGTITGSWSSEVIGALKMYQAQNSTAPLVKQTRQNKAALFGHQAEDTQKRETERFNWLRERGFDGQSHELDAITHALFYIKKRALHVPTIKKYWTDWGKNEGH